MTLPVITNNSGKNIEVINALVAQHLPKAIIYKEGLHVTFSFIVSDLINAVNNNNQPVIKAILNLLNDVVALNTPESDDVVGTTVFISLFDEFQENQSLIPLSLLSIQAQTLYNTTIDRWKKPNGLV